MKRTSFALALTIALSLSGAAQEDKAPVVSRHRAGHPAVEVQESKDSLSPSLPALCKPCLFYGGDINPSSPNAAGLPDGNTLLASVSGSTYGAVKIPAGVTATIKGVLFNVQGLAAFDPRTASYDIRTGVSEGDGGTSIASGTAHIEVAQTGRVFLGAYEYSVVVRFPRITLVSGEYWINVTPNCTNTLDGSCIVFGQFVSNTTSKTNNLRGSWQPAHEMFLNSPLSGVTWANWCDPDQDLNQVQCARLSFGLLGGVE
ncbi:MAG: hypothetical protein WCA20_21425 [Candidatus Sulfotelmatobacter sp.]